MLATSMALRILVFAHKLSKSNHPMITLGDFSISLLAQMHSPGPRSLSGATLAWLPCHPPQAQSFIPANGFSMQPHVPRVVA